MCSQCVQTLHQKDGPPLSLGEQLYRGEQPEVLCALHGESSNTGDLMNANISIF